MYYINEEFDITNLIRDKKYGFEKVSNNRYEFLDITVPIIVNVETREVIVPNSIGVVSTIYQGLVINTLIEQNIIKEK